MTAAGKEPAPPAQGARPPAARQPAAQQPQAHRPTAQPPAPHNPLDAALEMLRGHWPLLLPLVILLPLSIFAASLWQSYFRHYELPGIVAAHGAVPCAQFVSSLPQRAPRHCAVAVTNAAASATTNASPAGPSANQPTNPPANPAATPAVRHELFYFDDDSVFAMLLRPGAEPLVVVHCDARSKQALIVLLGLLLIGVATISNKLRTGRFFSFWPIRASQLQPHEILLLVYGVAILFGGIVGTQIASCAAQQHAALTGR